MQTHKLQKDCVKMNEPAIRSLIRDLVEIEDDDTVNLVPLREHLYREFRREATDRESETLEDYVWDYVQELSLLMRRRSQF